LLEEYSELRNKIFIPSDHDIKLANTVLRFFERNYDSDIMVRCMKRYLVKSKEIAVSLDDFTKRLTGLCDEVVAERRSREEIAELLAKTKERMEELNHNEL
jgi:hypothetical protein